MKVVGLVLWINCWIIGLFGETPLSGISDERSQIIGGEEVKPHALPWQVFLKAFIKGDPIHYHQCGGTIICPNYIATAAHCLEDIQDDPSLAHVFDGIHNFPRYLGTFHRGRKIYIHPEREGWNMDYAVLKLETPIEMRTEARALFLPDGREHFKPGNTLFVASGWGRTGHHDPSSEVLKSVTIPYISPRKCKRVDYGRKFYICAGDWKTGQIGTCKGDSGGPLAYLDPKTDQVKLVGMTSWGEKDCDAPKLPGLYSDVTKIVEWIKDIIGNCNDKTCNEGMCMTKKTLDKWALKRFSRVSPHLAV